MYNTVSARELQRNLKAVMKKVKKSGQPYIIMSKNEPIGFVADMNSINSGMIPYQRSPIIHRDEPNEIKKTKPVKHTASILLELAALGKKYHAKGPRDLAKNHDKYTWDE